MLALLPAWWCVAGSAQAASYPPALSCAVSGFAQTGTDLLQVRGTGFGSDATVLVSLDGRRTGAVRADAAGSFATSWQTGGLFPGARVTAAGAGCTAIAALAIENSQGGTGNSALPPVTGKPRPAQRPKAHPPASATRPQPVPPSRIADPAAAAIPSIPLTGLPPQLFLGLAGAVMLAGVALTGLTGRLGHRRELEPPPAASMSTAWPATPGTT